MKKTIYVVEKSYKWEERNYYPVAFVVSKEDAKNRMLKFIEKDGNHCPKEKHNYRISEYKRIGLIEQ